MRLALGFDAFDASGRPYFSPDRTRVADPWVRKKLARYLSTAGEVAVRGDKMAVDPFAPERGPVVPTGYRTDGTWTWQEALAYYAGEHGVAPEPEFLAYLEGRGFQAPDSVPPEQVTRAHRVVSGLQRRQPDKPYTRYVVAVDGDHPPHAPLALLRRLSADGQPSLHQLLDRDLRWRPTAGVPVGAWTDLREITAEQAAAVIDRWRVDLSAEIARTPRLARGFDATSAAGSPYFSPDRPRVGDPELRRKLDTYLAGGQLAVRADAMVEDPLAPQRGPVVPLGYRTDGRWVWQEALAYYAREHGIGPEPDFLADIEERRFRPSDPVPEDVLMRAARVALAPGSPRPPRPAATYYAGVDGAHPASAPLFLVRRSHLPDGGVLDEALHRDLRWHRTAALVANERTNEYSFAEITEEQAVDVMDRSCATWSAAQQPSRPGAP